MTGKQQKAKAVLDDFKKRMEITQEEKIALVDSAILEVHSANADFLERFNMPIKAFRGMYIVHTFFGMIDKLVEEKMQAKLNEKVQQYQREEELKRRR